MLKDRYECLSCKGKYYSVQNNLPYYHSCPPETKDPRNENVIGGTGKDKDNPKEEGKGRKKV